MNFTSLSDPNRVPIEKDGEIKSVPKENLSEALKLGYKEISRADLATKLTIPTSEKLIDATRTPILNESGELKTVPKDNLQQAIELGYRPATQQEIAFAASLNAAKEKILDQAEVAKEFPGTAMALGAVKGATEAIGGAGAVAATAPLAAMTGPAAPAVGTAAYLGGSYAAGKAFDKSVDLLGGRDALDVLKAEHSGKMATTELASQLLTGNAGGVLNTSGKIASKVNLPKISEALTKAATALDKSNKFGVSMTEAGQIVNQGLNKLVKTPLAKLPSPIRNTLSTAPGAAAENMFWGVQQAVTESEIEKDPNKWAENLALDGGIGFLFDAAPKGLGEILKAGKPLYNKGKQILGVDEKILARDWGVSEETIGKLAKGIDNPKGYNPSTINFNPEQVEGQIKTAAQSLQTVEERTKSIISSGYGALKEGIIDTHLTGKATDEQLLSAMYLIDDLRNTASQSVLNKSELFAGSLNRFTQIADELQRQIASSGSLTQADLYRQLYGLKDVFEDAAKYKKALSDMGPLGENSAKLFREARSKVRALTEDKKLWGEPVTNVVKRQNSVIQEIYNTDDLFEQRFQTELNTGIKNRERLQVSDSKTGGYLGGVREGFTTTGITDQVNTLKARQAANKRMRDTVLDLIKENNADGKFDDVLAKALHDAQVADQADGIFKGINEKMGLYNTLNSLPTADPGKLAIKRAFLNAVGASAVGYMVGGQEGAIFGLGVGSTASAFSQMRPDTKLKMLNWLTDKEKKVSGIVGKAKTGILKQTGKIPTTNIPVVPVATILGRQTSGSPEEQIQQHRSDLKIAREYIGKDMIRSSGVAALDNAAKQHQLNLIDLLEQELPQVEKIDPIEGKTLKKLSAEQKAKFELTVRVANDPMSVFRNLANGKVNRLELNTLQRFWPTLYKRLETEVLDEVAKQRALGKPVSPEIKNRVKAVIGFGYQDPHARTIQMIYEREGQKQQKQQRQKTPSYKTTQEMTQSQRLEYK